MQQETPTLESHCALSSFSSPSSFPSKIWQKQPGELQAVTRHCPFAVQSLLHTLNTPGRGWKSCKAPRGWGGPQAKDPPWCGITTVVWKVFLPNWAWFWLVPFVPHLPLRVCHILFLQDVRGNHTATEICSWKQPQPLGGADTEIEVRSENEAAGAAKTHLREPQNLPCHPQQPGFTVVPSSTATLRGFGGVFELELSLFTMEHLPPAELESRDHTEQCQHSLLLFYHNFAPITILEAKKDQDVW